MSDDLRARLALAVPTVDPEYAEFVASTLLPAVRAYVAEQLREVAARCEGQAMTSLDVASAFPDGPSRGQAVAFGCAADWMRDRADALGGELVDLADFLLARFADDEANTRACYEWSECGPHKWEDVGAGTYGCPAHPSVARQLAECEVKRQLVLDAQRVARPDPLRQGDYWRGVHEADRAWLRALALPYADHPDYCAEWRP